MLSNDNNLCLSNAFSRKTPYGSGDPLQHSFTGGTHPVGAGEKVFLFDCYICTTGKTQNDWL
jgi:hypothetical protein